MTNVKLEDSVLLVVVMDAVDSTDDEAVRCTVTKHVVVGVDVGGVGAGVGHEASGLAAVEPVSAVLLAVVMVTRDAGDQMVVLTLEFEQLIKVVCIIAPLALGYRLLREDVLEGFTPEVKDSVLVTVVMDALDALEILPLRTSKVKVLIVAGIPGNTRDARHQGGNTRVEEEHGGGR